MEPLILVLLFVGSAIFIFSKQTKQSQKPRPSKKVSVARGSRRRVPPMVRENHRPVRRPSNKNLPPMPKSMTLKGRAYVIDGDTIAIGGTKVRLAGIDAPELNMPWGQKSKWAMVAICKGQTITAELDGERSYDRLVGTCYLPDGRDIGAELIKQGLALDLPEFSRGKYRHLEPEGARKKLCNGMFGHASIKTVRQTTVYYKSTKNYESKAR